MMKMLLHFKVLPATGHDVKKIHKMTDYSKEWRYTEVPDPYYGGDEGFELVLDLLEDACEGLLEKTNLANNINNH
jgi:protein-tyrosine phosphatase